MYPEFFIPSGSESFHFEDELFEIPKCVIEFEKWKGEPVKETFGGKPIVSMDNKPMFAELAIMNHFKKSGWSSRWIETYGKAYNQPIFLSDWKDDKYKNQVHDSISDKNISGVLAGVAKMNNSSYSGCWDVIGWQKDRIIFAESKRIKKDSIRKTQTNWLIAGLKSGLKTNNFLVVQWDFKKEN
jgi:hypothetical protein